MLKLREFYKFLSRLSKREKLVFYGALFFVSMTLLDRLIISPISSKMKSLDKEIKEKEDSIRNSLRMLTQKDRILAARNKYSSFSKTLESEEEEITSLLKEIEGLANKSSVYLIDMKPASSKGSAASKKYLVNLNCEAQMEQLVDFMYNVENSNELLTIEKYQISPKSKSSSVAKCSIYISKMSIR